ncbi:hypothetical protein [Streptomyces sp. Ncost-T10-10d]|uniref:hypothetical protein n=1 Tax=Streptomyces sp. Ncost-T10-10d TaxID=1839774 RepID=UPI00114CE794|nr:hypothetical protein [Streptomyces sp. Ncost-T10-10d]
MAARVGRAAGMLVMAVSLSSAGCADTGSGGGGGSKERAAAAIEAARAFQHASVDQDWEAACEARTERLRQSLGADTVAECVEITGLPRLGDYSDARVSTGEAVEVSAFGPHPAGIGLRVTLATGTGNFGTVHTALRLVPGEQGAWLVDQTANLVDTEGTDAEAVRAALERK